MPSEFPMNDPQNIWQNTTYGGIQNVGRSTTAQGATARRKSRFEAVYSTIIGLALFVFFAWGCASPRVDSRIGFGVLSLWCAYFPNKSCKGILRKRLAPDATLDITARSYRTELEKRHDSGRRVWLTLTPVFLGMAMVIGPALLQSLYDPRLLLNLAPFALWDMVCAIFVPKRRRGPEAAAGDRAAKSV